MYVYVCVYIYTHICNTYNLFWEFVHGERENRPDVTSLTKICSRTVRESPFTRRVYFLPGTL